MSIPDGRSEVGSTIFDLLSSTLGPTGRNKMIIDQPGNVIVTNSTSTILGEMYAEMALVPAGRMIADLALTLDDIIGDGTTTSTLFACALIKESEALIERGIHPSHICKGYHMASELARDELRRQSVPIAPDDTSLLENIARTAMNGKGPNLNADLLSELVAKAVQTIHTRDIIELSDVTLVKARGGTISDSLLMNGLIVDTTDPLDLEMPDLIRNPGIALTDTDLPPSSLPKSSSGFEANNKQEFDTYVSYEERLAEETVEHLFEQGTRVLFSSGTVSKDVQTTLVNRGIMAMKSVTSDDLRHISKASGATIFSDPRQVRSSHIGEAEKVEIRNIGGDNFHVIEGCENPRSVTILLRGGNRYGLDEVERVVKHGLGSVKAAVEDGEVVPGGGGSEIAIATAVRNRANSVDSREQLAMYAFADAIEQVPHALATNLGYNPTDVVLDLRSHYAARDSSDEGLKRKAGVTEERGVVDDIIRYGVVEPRSKSTAIINSSTNIVNQILRIDEVVPATDLRPGKEVPNEEQ